MKKRVLPLLLTLALAVGLAVPAMANVTGSVDMPEDVMVNLTLDEMSLSVAPIGIAKWQQPVEDIYGEMQVRDFEAYVFDQDCTLSMKDGRVFDTYGLYTKDGRVIGDGVDGDAQFSVNDRPGCYSYTAYDFSSEDVSYYYNSPDMISKAYMDELTAAGIAVDFQPLTTATAAIPADAAAYTAQLYDTWGLIALNNYGAYGVWQQLMNANKGVKLVKDAVVVLPAALGETARIAPAAAGEGEKLYVVQAGDTLGTIAKAAYGDSSKYQAIYERNSDRLKNAATIYEGQIIVLPAKETAPAPVEEVPAPVEEVPAPAEETYTIQAGDTLGAIARTLYGDVLRYKDIYERNKDILKDANTIYPGQVITLPAK